MYFLVLHETGVHKELPVTLLKVFCSFFLAVLNLSDHSLFELAFNLKSIVQ